MRSDLVETGAVHHVRHDLLAVERADHVDQRLVDDGGGVFRAEADLATDQRARGTLSLQKCGRALANMHGRREAGARYDGDSDIGGWGHNLGNLESHSRQDLVEHAIRVINVMFEPCVVVSEYRICRAASGCEI